MQYRVSSAGTTLREEMLMQLKATLHSQMPSAAAHTVRAVYQLGWRTYVQLQMHHARSEYGQGRLG